VAKERTERRLAAIMSADVAGYSRLMGKNEAGTLSALKALRKDVFAPQVTAHKGRVVKLMGDGALVEFPSVVDAVDCAIAVQWALADRATDEAIKLRIGINLGDIIVEGSDIYGDGVNVAARIQEVAEPGGVALSGPAFDQIMGKVEADFEDAGEHELKNIDKPVRVYRWTDSAIVPMSSTADAEEALPLPDKPSIAALPFDNMSGDPEQEYFADGITEDIITELSRFREFSVIARNSTFQYKGQSPSVLDVGRDLGVQYVVEGSVRKAGNRVRVTAQLIDVASGNHIWAERYDRDLEDIFAVQDELTRSIVTTLATQLGKDVVQRAERKHPANVKAYEYYLWGNREYYRFSADYNVEANSLYAKAIELDPNFARAYAGLSNTYCTDFFLNWLRLMDAPAKGLEAARRAVELDGNDAWCRCQFGSAQIMNERWEQAEGEFDRALALRPGDAEVLVETGHGLIMVGRPEDGVGIIEEAIRLNPLYPDVHRRWLGIGLFRSRRYEDAVDALRAVNLLDGWGYAWLAAAYARLDQTKLAAGALEMFVKERRQELTSAGASSGSTTDILGNYRRNFKYEAEWEHFLGALRDAGLPG
jgi:TolB-like protein